MPKEFQVSAPQVLRRTMARCVLLACLALVAASGALAQNCAMCYDSARQQNSEASRALNTGIVVLLLPSLLLFGGVIVTALRHRETPEAEEE